MSPQQEAIVVRNATKSYGSGPPILDHLNMTVTRGTIYGFLGSSGSGKTTLLSCIVGVRKLNSGEIWVLGGHPGSKSSSIPGPLVGYMPQEISLAQEFTVLGAIYYFGRVNGMTDEEIEDKHAFLSNLLQLPPANRLLRNMSGGQQRRVSFACAMLHDPELLILDEPTVGLDPLLRETIWEYFLKLAKNHGTTIVITTHYIEEAKDVDKIGLLRNGALLAEASPRKLLSICNCDSLEEAFLQLSQRQNSATHSQMRPIEVELDEFQGVVSCDQNQNLQDGELERRREFSKYSGQRSFGHRSSRRRRFYALMVKNLFQFIRHPAAVLFAFVFPLLQVNAFFTAIGHDPMDIKIGVFNEEAGNCRDGRYLGQVIYNATEDMCDYVDLSCRFIGGFRKFVDIVHYDDYNSSYEAIQYDKTAGVLHFEKTFSQDLQNKRDNFYGAQVGSGQLQVSLDMGNRQIGLFLEKKLYEQFFEIYEDVISECKLPRRLVAVPLKFEEPVFGTMDQKVTTFMAPVFLTSVAFFLAAAVSSSIIIADRNEGIWSRSLVQGVQTPEILASHFIAQLVIVLIQISVTLIILFVQYDLECRGSMLVVIGMVLLQGIAGMSFGFLVSVYCTSHTVANYIVTGSFYPIILLCGLVWPVEGMPPSLRWLSFALPTTVPGIALRNVIDRGYELSNFQVYKGFLVTMGYMFVLIAMCLVGLRKKSS